MGLIESVISFFKTEDPEYGVDITDVGVEYGSTIVVTVRKVPYSKNDAAMMKSRAGIPSEHVYYFDSIKEARRDLPDDVGERVDLDQSQLDEFDRND